MTPASLMVLAILSGLGLAGSTNPAFDAAQKVGGLAFKTIRRHQKAVKDGAHQDAVKVRKELFEIRSKIIQSKNNLASHPNPDPGSGKYTKVSEDAIMQQLKSISEEIDTIFINKMKNDSICPFLLENAEKTLNDSVKYENFEKEIAKKLETPRGVITLISQEYDTRREEDKELPPLDKLNLTKLVCEKWKDLGDKVKEKNVIKSLLEEMNVKDVRTTSTTPPSVDKWDLLVTKLKIEFPHFPEMVGKTIKDLKAYFKKKKQEDVPFDSLAGEMRKIFVVPNTAFILYKIAYDRKRLKALEKVQPVLSEAALKQLVWLLWSRLRNRILRKTTVKAVLDKLFNKQTTQGL